MSMGTHAAEERVWAVRMQRRAGGKQQKGHCHTAVWERISMLLPAVCAAGGFSGPGRGMSIKPPLSAWLRRLERFGSTLEASICFVSLLNRSGPSGLRDLDLAHATEHSPPPPHKSASGTTRQVLLHGHQ